MTRYQPKLEDQFASFLRDLRDRIGAVESRTNAFGTNADGTVNIANLAVVNHGGGGATLMYLGAPGPGTLLMTVSGAAGTDGYGNGYPQGIGVFDGAGNQLGQWGAGGLVASPLGDLISPHPGTTPSVAETWQAPALGAGFAVPGGALAPPGYQFEAVGGGRVRLRGQANLTGTVGAGTAMFVLDSHYWPVYEQELSAPNTLGGAAGQGAAVGVDTAGNVKILPGGVAGNVVRLDGLTFPLD